MPAEPPPLARLTQAERRLVARCRTPVETERWLRALPYNHDEARETLRTFRGVVRHRRAHCAEGALAAAALLERQGRPPLVLDLRSEDCIDHLLAVYRGRDGRYGAVGKSKYPGLCGRRAVYRTVEDLVQSYLEPFVDFTGSVTEWALLDLREHPRDWRLDLRNVWHVQRALNEAAHARVNVPRREVERWRSRYVEWKKDRPPHAQPPVAFYRGLARAAW